MTTQPSYRKPLPMITPENERYWAGCREHELWLRYCRACGRYAFYPRDICPYPDCPAPRETEWRQASGRGALHTFAIVHRPPTPAFADDVPYITAIIDLEEGPRMLTNLVGVAPDPALLHIGQPVEVVFEDVTDTISLPKFRLRQ